MENRLKLLLFPPNSHGIRTPNAVLGWPRDQIQRNTIYKVLTIVLPKPRRSSTIIFRLAGWEPAKREPFQKAGRMDIHAMSDDELLKLFKNARRVLLSGANNRAELVIAEVERVWKNRLDLARAGQYSYQLPQMGMLATLGYHVGDTEGERTATRRQIIKYLLERQLPMVQSPAYTDEWDAPNSPRRYNKLVQVLESQINNPHNGRPSMARSMIEWREDLEWIQANFSHISGFDTGGPRVRDVSCDSP